MAADVKYVNYEAQITNLQQIIVKIVKQLKENNQNLIAYTVSRHIQ